MAREYHPGSGHSTAHDDLAQRPPPDPLLALGKRLGELADFRPSKRYQNALAIALEKAADARQAKFDASNIDAYRREYNAAARKFEVNAAATGSADEWRPYGSSPDHFEPIEASIETLQRKREAFEAAARAANYALLALVDDRWFSALVRFWDKYAVVHETPEMPMAEFRELEAEAARVRPLIIQTMKIASRAKGATPQIIRMMKEAQAKNPDVLANFVEVRAQVHGETAVEVNGDLVDIQDLRIILDEEEAEADAAVEVEQEPEVAE